MKPSIHETVESWTQEGRREDRAYGGLFLFCAVMAAADFRTDRYLADGWMLTGILPLLILWRSRTKRAGIARRRQAAAATRNVSDR